MILIITIQTAAAIIGKINLDKIKLPILSGAFVYANLIFIRNLLHLPSSLKSLFLLGCPLLTVKLPQ